MVLRCGSGALRDCIITHALEGRAQRIGLMRGTLKGPVRFYSTQRRVVTSSADRTASLIPARCMRCAADTSDRPTAEAFTALPWSTSFAHDCCRGGAAQESIEPRREVAWRTDREWTSSNVAARHRWRRCHSAAPCWASDVTCMRISWLRSACACLLAMLSMPDIGR